MEFLYWIIVGLIAGWLAGQVMKGGGYGVLVDIILGILGGVLGGWLFGLLGLWPGRGWIGSIIVAFARASDVTASRISMIGLAARPGTAVLPKCSIPMISPGSSVALNRSASTANIVCQRGSYGTISTSSIAKPLRPAPAAHAVWFPDR